MTVEERFWSKVAKSGEDDCWEWMAGCHKEGYGQFRFNHKQQLAHRVSWQLTNGPIPDGMFVCHTCDNRKCVNPSHCFLGTHQDNMTDMVTKNRQSNAKGEANGQAKLTENEVAAIRGLYAYSRYFTQQKLGELFEVSQMTISYIINNQTWKHV